MSAQNDRFDGFANTLAIIMARLPPVEATLQQPLDTSTATIVDAGAATAADTTTTATAATTPAITTAAAPTLAPDGQVATGSDIGLLEPSAKRQHGAGTADVETAGAEEYEIPLPTMMQQQQLHQQQQLLQQQQQQQTDGAATAVA